MIAPADGFDWKGPAPKDPEQNIAYRRAILKRAHGDREFQRLCWMRAARDWEWFSDTFLWTYSIQDHPECPDRPFILWPFQVELIRDLITAFSQGKTAHPILVEKSRDMGATYCNLFAFFWAWMFRSRQSFLCGSRKEEYVDKSGDPKCLFWKLRYYLDNLPSWMRPRILDNKLHLENLDNGSTIDGESTNDDFGTGDRRVAVLLDEFPLVENGDSIVRACLNVSRCIIYNGTANGPRGAYYEVRQKMAELHPERIKRLHWSMHPERKRGLYCTADGKPGSPLRILDAEYIFPPGYRFVLDGKLRSPYYDDMEERSPNQLHIAQNLDIDYAASSARLIEPAKLETLIGEMARPAMRRGELSFEINDHSRSSFTENDVGRLQLWCNILPSGKPAVSGECVVGVDVATGAGGSESSNSVISVVEKTTGRKVAQFHSNAVEPHALCDMAVAICHWFGHEGHGAPLIWENQGPGTNFGLRLKRIGYRRTFDDAGWVTTIDSKRLLLTEYARALWAREFTNPCLAALKEVGEYEQGMNGEVYHVRSKPKDKGSADPNATGKLHGDMVIADALAWHLITAKPKPSAKSEPAKFPAGSFGARRREYERASQQTTYY